MGDSKGRLVLVTGASAGIGLATARAFVRAGDTVVGVARDTERLDRIHAELRGFSGRAADVGDGPSMEAMASGVLRDHGVPDVVVANAGIGLDARFVDTDDDALRRVLEVNVVGVVRTLRPFVPGMVERGSGRLLVVSSIVGKRGTPCYSAYSASKFALHGMADALRPELRGSGVTVGLICPSSTESEFQERIARVGQGQKRTRLRRHSAESVARAIVRMADSRRREIILGAEARLMHAVDCLAPGVIDYVLARMLNRRPGEE